MAFFFSIAELETEQQREKKRQPKTNRQASSEKWSKAPEELSKDITRSNVRVRSKKNSPSCYLSVKKPKPPRELLSLPQHSLGTCNAALCLGLIRPAQTPTHRLQKLGRWILTSLNSSQLWNVGTTWSSELEVNSQCFLYFTDEDNWHFNDAVHDIFKWHS